MEMINQTQQTTVTARLRSAKSFWTRARGLLFHTPLQPGEGLWLVPCRWVHTWGMPRPIEVIYLDAGGRVLAMQTLEPNRFGRYVSRAQSVLEVPVGTWADARCAVGDRLEGVIPPTRAHEAA